MERRRAPAPVTIAAAGSPPRSDRDVCRPHGPSSPPLRRSGPARTAAGPAADARRPAIADARPECPTSARLIDRLEAAVVGQRAVLERLVIALLAGGHVLIEGVPGLAKTRAVRRPGHGARPALPPHPVHPRPAPGRPDRHPDLPPPDRPLRRQARADRHQRPAGRRDQPRPGQGPECPARGDAGRPGHHRRRDDPSCPTRSSCSPRRTRSSTRGPTRCPRPSSTAS